MKLGGVATGKYFLKSHKRLRAALALAQRVNRHKLLGLFAIHQQWTLLMAMSLPINQE